MNSKITGRDEPQPHREIGPDRFHRQQAALNAGAGEERNIFTAIGAAIAVLVVIVGVPFALLAAGGGPPIPTSVPDRATLTTALGFDQLLTVLLVIVWLAWLQFTVCFVVEVISAIKGVGLPGKVPLSGPTQQLARNLVGALLVTAAVVGPVQQALAATSYAPAAPGTVATQVTNIPTGLIADPARVADVAQSVLELTAHSELPGAQAVAISTDLPKLYTVKAPEAGRHDNLWDIAEKHLGDGRRYKEIHQLNVGREQADGQRLELDRLIQPGWKLIMPEDAVGVSRASLPGTPGAAVIAPPPVQTPAPQAPVESEPEVPETAPVQQAPAVREAPVVPQAPVVPADERPVSAAPQGESGGIAGDLAPGLVGGGLLAAGLLMALLRARRRTAATLDPAAAEAEVALRVGADIQRRMTLDLTLRDLRDRCADQDLPLPSVFAARSSSDQVELLLAPAALRAPDGWQVLADGTCWRSPLISEVEVPAQAEQGPGPYPALVSIGRDAEGRDMLIDLDAADGPVSLTGDPAATAEVGTAMALSLATAPWAGPLVVEASGLSATVRSLGVARLRSLDTELEVSQAIGRILADQTQVDPVLTGVTGSSHNQVLVLAANPGQQALTALTTGMGERTCAVLVAADLPDATWRLHVDEAGTVEVQPLDLRVTGYRLNEHELLTLARLLGEARLRPTQPRASSVNAPLGIEIDGAGWLASPARLSFLGAPEVRAGGALDPSRVPLATEIVSFLAVHRDGVHPTVLGGSIWPRGVGAEVRDATIERVRDWLGEDIHGGTLLLSLPDGRLKLSDQVPSDWDAIRTLNFRANHLRGQPGEAELLRRALRVVRGPLLSGAPQGRYAWVARTSLEHQITETVVAIAHRLSELQRELDPPAAVAAATSGLRCAPREQLLWRDVLSAAAQHDLANSVTTPVQVPAAVSRMRAVLTDLGDALEPETEALVEFLLPGVVSAHPA